MTWITMLDGHQYSSSTHNCVGSWEWWRVAVYLWPVIELHHIVCFLSFQFDTSCIWYAMAWITMLDGHQYSPFTHNCMGSWEWWRVAVYLWHAIGLHHIVRFFSFQFDTSCIWYAMAWMTMLDGHQYSPFTHNCMGSWEWSWGTVYLWLVIELYHIVCFLSF